MLALEGSPVRLWDTETAALDWEREQPVVPKGRDGFLFLTLQLTQP